MNQDLTKISKEEALNVIENDIYVGGLFQLLNRIEQRLERNGSGEIIINKVEAYDRHSSSVDTSKQNSIKEQPHKRCNSKRRT